MVLHVVLDIDDTLLKHTKKAIQPLIPNRDKFQAEPSLSGLFVLRPHLDEFMKELFENQEVSLWTWSDWGQVNRVAQMLKRRQEAANPGKTAKFKDLLSEEDADLSTTLHGMKGKDLNQLWQDYNQAFVDKFSKMPDGPENVRRAKAAVAHLNKRNATISAINEERGDNDEELWNPGPKTFFTGYKPCNTVLVDDAEYNYVVPATRKNMVLIKPFGGKTESAATKGSVPTLDENDQGLLKTLEILKAVDQSCRDPHAALYPKGGPRAGKRNTRRIKKKGTRRSRK